MVAFPMLQRKIYYILCYHNVVFRIFDVIKCKHDTVSNHAASDHW